MSNASAIELKHHALRRLAHIIVGEETNIFDSVLQFLVEQTLLDKGESSRKEIANGIQEIFLIKFLSSEFEDVLQKLAKEGHLKELNGKFLLEINRADKLRKINSSTKQFEEKIFNDWIAFVFSKYPELTDEDKKNLVGDLQTYLNKIFLRHGAECTILIYPDSEKLAAFVKTFSDENLDKLLPARTSELMKVRKIELPLFLRQVDSEKKKYFASILDGTFVYNLVQVDPQTRKFLSSNFEHYTLYLDTNVLYSLFDLENSKRATTVEKAINMARSFGIKITVSQKTIDEMKKSIELRGESLLDSPYIKREFAEIGADLSEEENFITAYWRANYKTGISKEDFIKKFEHVAELLKAKSIPVDSNPMAFSTKDLENEKRLLNESILLPKKDSVAEHDAYHRLLIKYLRREAERKQTPDRYWFLTLDNQLLIYGRKTREKGEMPFALFPHQLFQLLRPFVRRTDDYDEAFVELFSRPQIKSAQGILPNNLAEKILAKISSFNDIPPEIALSIMMNSNFVSTISKEGDEAIIRQKITEQVESHLAIEVRQLKERMGAIEIQRQKEASGFEVESTKEKRLLKKKSEEIIRLKNIILGVSILLLILVNVFLFCDYWNSATKIMKGLWIFVDIVALSFILKIRWSMSQSFIWVATILGVVQFIFWAIDYPG